jgi:hypothetical protein
MITVHLEVLIAITIPLIILLFSIGVATGTVKHKLNRQDEKMDLMLQKQDITNGKVLKHSEEFLDQGWINRDFHGRLIRLEQTEIQE